MQSENLESVSTSISESPQSPIKMTLSDNNEDSSLKLATQASTDDSGNIECYPQETRSNDEMNLEDDIEKVEISSVESSENNEEAEEEEEEGIGWTPPITNITTVHPEENSAESIKTWFQRISAHQKKLSNETVTSANNLGSEHNNATNNSYARQTTQQHSSSVSSGRCVKYQDLPYMGEMTLANSKPRRGRKPKKADICHLIYKNYGTILPGTPTSKNFAEKDILDKKDNHVINDEECFSNRSSIQNKLISSLLEKRLTQEIKKTISPTVSKKEQRGSTFKCDQNEPLNLCIRDLNHLKIRFMKKPDNTYIMSGMKSKQESDELIRDSPSPPSTATTVQPQSLFENILSASSPDLSQIPENGAAPPGYVYWPNAGVFIHPMALQQQMMYYQRMASNSSYTLPSHSPRPPPETPPQLSPHREGKKVVVRKEKKADAATSETEKTQSDQKTKRNASSVSFDRTPTKRKRSAIFIPPIPPESATNPTTEVSICKFKFTGGAKPSLQEKKMLSVDSGGNFRYYSGTGDKSMRGYEFFPRETLQQQISNSHGSSTGAFLQASGEKIYPIAPIDFASASKSTDFLLTPEIPSAQLQELNSKHKKRKSRKSIQREKLEQTFKEKGFLIQTQQLESAEGATYCKFRQLRKFTRYLFRSWKDYLPGNVTDLQEGGKDVSGCGEGDVEEDIDSLSRHSGSDIGGSSNVQL